MADSPTDSKSGICSPAGYNGFKPASLEVKTKVYPASSKIGKTDTSTIEGPAENQNYNGDDKR